VRTLDVFRTSVAAAALGLARRALDESLAYVRQRSLFGKKLIIARIAARNRISRCSPNGAYDYYFGHSFAVSPTKTVAPNPDPLRTDPAAYVDNSCVGCGVCGEVAHAAVLRPSFYRADLVHNPTVWDRILARIRQGVAQRTGATLYYMEFFSKDLTEDGRKMPVMALMPIPGDVVRVLASELLEACRTVERGLVTADRTLVIASIHRVYIISERRALSVCDSLPRPTRKGTRSIRK
jgi:hypothetical protein